MGEQSADVAKQRDLSSASNLSLVRNQNRIKIIRKIKRENGLGECGKEQLEAGWQQGRKKKPNPINFRIRILLSMRQIYENKIIRRKRGSYRTIGVRLAYIL